METCVVKWEDEESSGWTLLVNYPVDMHEADIAIRQRDAMIERIVGREPEHTGYFLESDSEGMRDMEFDFSSREEAAEAESKLKKAFQTPS